MSYLNQNTGAPTGRVGRFLVLTAVLLIGASMGGAANAGPFEACPSKAFLVQDTVARLYGVNLATGYFQELSNDMGTQSKLNATGFNFHDDYLYAWSYEHRTLARIDSDFQVTPLAVNNLPNADFYVGDIAVDRNVYYFYKPGSSYGLYGIDLDPPGNAPLSAERIIDGQSLNLAIFDMAFHPDNTLAYAVSRQGSLYEINARTGSYQTIGNIGQSGTFGAAYFDVDGYLYLSRNSDGHVFRVDLSAAEPTAQFYAYGPASGNNDGARCAMAPIIPEGTQEIDFGDAPDSYGTTLEKNGARHDLESTDIYLGALVDGESNAYLYPLSDDSADQSADEDGVQFVTGLELGQEAILAVESSAPAFLNAWMDWNQNGRFDSDEQVITQQFVAAGQNNLVIGVPVWSASGQTWARFRLSSTPDIGPTGGVGDGEVEDYQISVTADGIAEFNYPSAASWATIAYEDNWPLQGDYDLNDLVVKLRSRELVRDDDVMGIELNGQVAAVGGDFHNGFAIRLPGVDAGQLTESAVQFWINDTLQLTSPLESRSGDAIFVITEDVWDYVSAGEGCNYYRTEVDCESPVQMEFKLRIGFFGGIARATFPVAPYDPFMFATPGEDRGYLFASPPGRKLEIHLPGRGPTEKFDRAFFGLGEDFSEPDAGLYFRNANGMPWALQIDYEWNYPLEYVDVVDAYPDFEPFVTSAGQTNGDWYLEDNAVPNLVFQSKD